MTGHRVADHGLAGNTWLVGWMLLACSAGIAGRSPAAQPPVTALAVSPDGRHVVVGSQAGLSIRPLPKLDRVKSISTRLRQIHDIAFHPRGDRFAVGGGTPSESGGFEVYSWPALKRIRSAAPHRDVVYGVAWRGDAVATAGLDRQCRITDQRRTRVVEGHSRGVTCVASLGDDFLLTASLDQSIRVWRLEKVGPKLVRTLDNHTQGVHDLAARPDGEGLPWAVSVGGDRSVRFWQPTIGRMVRFRRIAGAVPLSVTWLDRQFVAVACTDGAVRVIDSEDAAVVQTANALKGWAHAIAAGPKGTFAVVGGEKGIVRVVATPR